MCFTLAAMRSPRLFALPRESGGQLDPTGRLPACLYISTPERTPPEASSRWCGIVDRLRAHSGREADRGGSSRASSERDCIVAGRSIGVSIVAGHGVEGELLGRGADPARRPLPRGVPPLALAHRPPQPAQLHRRHQRRRAPPLGLLHDEGTSSSCRVVRARTHATLMSLMAMAARSDLILPAARSIVDACRTTRSRRSWWCSRCGTC
jgi:hypothetical protein